MSPRRVAGLVLLGTLLLQSAWIAVMPPFRGTDEFDHAFRASAVAHGEWEAGDWVTFGRGRLVTVPASLVSAANGQCAALRYTGHDNCFPVARVHPDHGDMVTIGSSAAGYSPVFYWPVGMAGRPFSGAGSLYAMRIVAAVLCAVFVALGAWCVAAARLGTWSIAGLVLALSPVAIYTMMLPAPNGLELAAAASLWCALLALVVGVPPTLERRVLVVAGVSAVLLVGLRELGPEFLALIVGASAAVAPRRAWAVVRRHPGTVVVIGVLTAIHLAGVLLWRTSQAAFGPQPVPDPTTAMRPSFVVLWPLQAVAAAPFRDQAAPAAVYFLFAAVLLAFLWVALRAAPARLRGLIIGLLGVGFVMPLAATWATYSERGVIWQGRYGLAALVGIPLVASVPLRRWRPPRAERVLVPAAVLLVVVHAVSLLKVLHDERLRPVSADDPAWHAPSPLLVVVLVVAGWLAYLAAVRASRAPA